MIRAPRFRPGLGSADPAGSMGAQFWDARKRIAEQRMREFDRQPGNVRDIANVTGFAESARYFKTAAEAERAIAEHALQQLEQSFHTDLAAAQAETLGITRKSRLSP